MNIHEYQAKEIFKTFNIPVLSGHKVETTKEAVAWAQKNPSSIWAIKAQIHAGGRGQGGGVKLAHNLDEVKTYASQILGMNLVTKQTNKKGQKVRKILIEKGCEIKKEYYIAALVDRTYSGVSFMVSSEGGMDIEEVAHKYPEKIHRIQVDPALGLMPFQARQLAFKLGFTQKQAFKAAHIFENLYKIFKKYDCSLVEINPLVETKNGELFALDAKMGFDSNALYRQIQITKYRDLHEEDPAEVEASKHDLALIKLKGPIGCMVNGAGLAMATMDIIKLYGSEPAHFLDVGGGASQEKVTAAFKLITQDKEVKVVLVNIFGGIMKCDVIAQGIVSAIKEVGLKHPLIVRLEGTRVKAGKKILEESGLKIFLATDLKDAAQKAVQVAKQTK